MNNFWYLGWADSDRKKAVSTKVRDAAAAFARRFGAKPAEVLVAPAEVAVRVAGIAVREVSYLRPGTYLVGPIDEELLRR